jgi:hypothetical protein
MENENSQPAVNQGETNTVTEETNVVTSTYEEDMEKYTKIDNLDEDPVNGDNINYIIVSFASPERIMNCNIRALKIRNYKGKPAIFNTYEEADKAAKELQLVDKYFDVFVMTNGKWYAWDPNPADRKYVQAERFDNSKEQEVMDGINNTAVERQQKQLNEMNALIGKKKAMIDDSKHENQKRKQELIKQGTTEGQGGQESKETTETSEVKETKETKKKTPHNNLAIKERLRKRIEQKRMEELRKPANTTDLVSKSKLDEVKQTESDVNIVNNNINKAKQLLAKMKQNQ